MFHFISGFLLQSFFLVVVARTSQIVCRRFFAENPISVRWSAAGLIFCWLLSVYFSVLLPPGFFKPLMACLLAVSGLLLVRHLLAPGEKLFCSGVSISNPLFRLFAVIGKNTNLRILAVVFLFFSILLTLRTLALPLLGWDTLTYHGLKAGSWVQTGGWLLLDAPGAWESYRSFLGGGEVFTAWAMLFLRSDALAGLPDVFFWLFLGLTIFALSRQTGMNHGNAFAVMAAFCCTVEISRMVGTGYVDTTATAFLLSSILFAIQSLRSGRITDILLTTAGFGLASSVKVNAMATSFITLAVFLVLLIRVRSLRPIQLFAGCFFFFAPVIQWLIFNYHITGFPLGCAPAALGSLKLGEAPPNLLWFLDRPALEPYTIKKELSAMVLALYRYGFALLMVLLAFPGYLANFFSNRREFMMRTVMIAAVLGLFFSPSFSVIRLIWGKVNGRFIAPALILMVVSSLHDLQRFKFGSRLIEFAAVLSAVTGVLWYLFLYCVGRHHVELIIAAIAALSALVAAIGAGQRFLSKTVLFSRGVCLTFFLTSLVVSLGAFGFKNWFRTVAYVRCEIMHYFPSNWVPGLAEIDKEPGTKHIAFSYGVDQTGHGVFVAPFLGERLENRLSYISPDVTGEIIPHHPEFQKKARLDFTSWLERLKSAGISHFLSFKPPGAELSWVESHPEIFCRLAGDGKSWGLYRIKFSQSFDKGL